MLLRFIDAFFRKRGVVDEAGRSIEAAAVLSRSPAVYECRVAVAVDGASSSFPFRGVPPPRPPPTVDAVPSGDLC